MASKKILVDIQVRDLNASKTINKTTKAVDGLAKSTEQLAGRTSKNKAESGLNNAILMETGRLASDASYGFQGMANNLGQIVSLIQISAKNSGGFAQALRDVGKSIMGTGGILIAVQLLISFLPKIAKKFTESREKAKGLTEAIKELREEYTDLKTRIEESNEALIEQDETVENLLVRLRRAVKGNLLFRFFGKTDYIDKTIERLNGLGVAVDKSELLRFKNDPDGLNEYIDKLIENTDKLDEVTKSVTDFGRSSKMEPAECLLVSFAGGRGDPGARAGLCSGNSLCGSGCRESRRASARGRVFYCFRAYFVFRECRGPLRNRTLQNAGIRRPLGGNRPNSLSGYRPESLAFSLWCSGQFFGPYRAAAGK